MEEFRCLVQLHTLFLILVCGSALVLCFLGCMCYQTTSVGVI